MKNEVPKDFIKKSFEKMNSKDEIVFRLYDNKTDTINYKNFTIPIDGLILQGNLQAFKLKKPYLNTIDFRMRVDTGIIYLETLNRNRKDYDRFFNPFFDCNICHINQEPKFDDSISERIKEELSKGFQYINTNANSLDYKYGEFCYINNRWHFLRLREHPNSTVNAITIASLIYNPIHTKEGYFNNVNNKDALVKSFHEMSHAIRKKLFTMIHNEVPEAKRMLDICCGRGGDLEEAKKIGIRMFVGIDSDRDSLCEYGLKMPFSSLVQHGTICKGNLTKLIKSIDNRRGFNLCDICLIDFGVHYLSDCLNELSILIKSLTVPNAKIFVTYFDSDSIIKKANAGKVKIDELTIEILEDGNLNMPLPTISKDGHREEPMINKAQLTVLGSKPRVFPLSIKKIDAKGFEKISDYTKFIKLAIFN